jgi:hypothetical protein
VRITPILDQSKKKAFFIKLKLHSYSKHSTLPFSLSKLVINRIRCSQMARKGRNSPDLINKTLNLITINCFEIMVSHTTDL